MKIRQYTAPTIQEALIKIKLDLGPDAVILHQRKLKKGGFLGFFGKELVEVLAAVDNSVPAPKPRKREPEPVDDFPAMPRRSAPTGTLAAGGIGPWDAPLPANGEPAAGGSAGYPAGGQAVGVSGHPGGGQAVGVSGHPGGGSAVVPAGAPAGGAALTEQVKSAVLGELADQVREVVSRAVGTAVGEVAEKVAQTMAGKVAESMADSVEAAVSRLEAAAPTKGSWTPAQQKIYDRLLRVDLDQGLARQTLVKLHSVGASTDEQMAERLPEVMTSFIKVAGAIQPPEPGQGPRVVILVGPTGVGKTTTIAKLAATFRLGGHSVGLVTIDTYRIAAVEQLKVYGDIIGIPVEVVMTPGALREAIGKLSDREMILVDTAGRSPSHKLHLGELRGFLEAVGSREVHLVLSATATRANLLRAIESFSQVGLDRLLITKVDEAATLGAVVSALHNASKPLSYVTHGQSVPDDLRVAESLALAKAMLGES